MKYIIQVINQYDKSVLYLTHDYITVSQSKALRFDTREQAQIVIDRVCMSFKFDYAVEEVDQ